jgi:protein SCO1/2
MNWKLAAVATCLWALCVGCERRESSGVPTNIPPRRMFQVTGTIVAVQPADKSVEIQHDEIPGYMAAMTMPFDVKDTNELVGLHVNDRVTFQMIVLPDDAWIEQIKVTGQAAVIPAAKIQVVHEAEPLSVGDALPERHFTNELGQAVSTTQFKGQAVVITFLFTRCPYPTFCPLMAANLASTQRRLAALTNGPTNWQLLAVTIDPEHDSPAVLREYAQRYNYDPAKWSFLTGELGNITAFAEQFGLKFERDARSGLPNHNLRTVVVGANGRIQSIVAGNEWTVDELVRGVVKAASARP